MRKLLLPAWILVLFAGALAADFGFQAQAGGAEYSFAQYKSEARPRAEALLARLKADKPAEAQKLTASCDANAGFKSCSFD